MATVTTPVGQLASELVDVLFEQDPLAPTLLGLDGPHDRLADLREETERRFRDRLAELADHADAVDPGGLDATDRVTRAVIIQQARAAIASIDSRMVEFTITDLFVSPASVLLAMLPMVALSDQAHARAYLDRLAAIPAHLDQAGDRHRAGVQAGRLPVARLVEAAVKHLDRYLADPAADPLALPVPPADDETFAADFARRRERVLTDVVRPAFARYRDVLADEVLPHGRSTDVPGLCWLPDGERIYADLVTVHTTTVRTPDDLHRTGLEIIERLAADYAEIGRRVFGTDDVTEIFHLLRTDSRVRWRDAEQLLDTARSAIARAEQAAPRWFGRLPEQRCEVRPVPESDAAGAAPAFYVPPAMDGSRPGVYYANTYQVTRRPRHVAESTAFHEAVPGHHLQLSLALGLTELPLLRRIANVNAYTEGWGLYAERLADEMGLYSDDLASLGMLAADSMRAGRLVVDTGLHAKGWSRETAVDFLSRNTPMAEVEIESEVDRYIAWPGQALSYMVGRLEIMRMREFAQRALGERFDVRAFHDLVLGGGPLPLSVLDGVVSEWVRARGGPQR